MPRRCPLLAPAGLGKGHTRPCHSPPALATPDPGTPQLPHPPPWDPSAPGTCILRAPTRSGQPPARGAMGSRHPCCKCRQMSPRHGLGTTQQHPSLSWLPAAAGGHAGRRTGGTAAWHPRPFSRRVLGRGHMWPSSGLGCWVPAPSLVPSWWGAGPVFCCGGCG